MRMSSRQLKNILEGSNKVPEKTIQKECEAYLDAQGIPYIRVPDELLADVQRTGSPAAKRSVTRCFAGQPDLIILISHSQYLPVELKSATGKLSEKQKEWWTKIGKEPIICRSLEEMIFEIDAFTFKTKLDEHKMEFGNP